MTHVSRKEGGRGLTSREDSVDALTQRLKDYMKTSQERLITVTRNSTCNLKINRITITWKQKWEEKQWYGYFKWQTHENACKNTWTWLRKGNIERETEPLLMAAQNSTIRTYYVKVKIYKTQLNSKCRLCDDREKWNLQSHNQGIQPISTKRVQE